jgi:hypothetical protein
MQIVAVAPPHAGGAADVEVWNPDGAMASADLAYRFDVPTAGSFRKHSPNPDVVITEYSVTLRWDASADATLYQVCFDTVDDNQCSIEPASSFGWVTAHSSTSVTWPRNYFAANTPYYWQVRAVNTGGIVEADAGDWARFAVAQISIAELTSPDARWLLDSTEATFTWTAGNGVAEYRLEIGRAPGVADVFSVTTTSRSAAVSGLPLNAGTLFVRIGSSIDGSWLFKDYAFTVRPPGPGLGAGGPNRGRRP